MKTTNRDAMDCLFEGKCVVTQTNHRNEFDISNSNQHSRVSPNVLGYDSMSKKKQGQHLAQMRPSSCPCYGNERSPVRS